MDTRLTILLVCLSSSVFGVKIGAFNIQTFGQTKASKPEIMSILGKIISRYDLVLIQEIRDIAQTAILQLLAEANSQSPHRYAMVISDRLGRTSYKEQYAFFFRNESGVRLMDSYHYDDGDEALGEDIFMREPFVTHFRMDKAVIKDVIFIPLHASPEFAVKEISALVDVHDDAVKRWGITNVMVLGDLNADCSYVRASDWPGIDLRTDASFEWLINDDTDTTVSTTDCAYDRIVVTGDSLKAGLLPGTASAYRFEDDYDLSYQEALAVSDHYPVEVELKLE